MKPVINYNETKKDMRIAVADGQNTETVTMQEFMNQYASGHNWEYYLNIFESGKSTDKLDWYCGYKTAKKA